MNHQWTCDRHRFIEYLTNRRPLDSTAIRTVDDDCVATTYGEEIVLVWTESPTETFSLPNAVIVTDESVSDFLAWISTYFRHLRPFTAHCRVLTPATVKLCGELRSKSLRIDLRLADIGMIVAEAIAYSVGRTELTRLTFPAFSRTLSFALASAARRYGQTQITGVGLFEQIRDGWMTVRELSQQPPLDLPPSAIFDVWGITLMACTSDPHLIHNRRHEAMLIEAIVAIRDTGRIPRTLWKRLLPALPSGESLQDVMEGPREARVKTIELTLKELAHAPSGSRLERAFLAGYLASQIQPGSLDHFPILFPWITELRESLLWYGVCAGLTSESTVDAYGNGLGLLMKRELERPAHWLDRPQSDVALSEFSMLLPSRDGIRPSIHTLISGTLNVELLPLVSTSVKWSEVPEDQSSDRRWLSSHEKTLFGNESHLRQDMEELLRRVGDSSKNLEMIRKQVESVFGEHFPKNRNRKKS